MQGTMWVQCQHDWQGAVLASHVLCTEKCCCRSRGSLGSNATRCWLLMWHLCCGLAHEDVEGGVAARTCHAVCDRIEWSSRGLYPALLDGTRDALTDCVVILNGAYIRSAKQGCYPEVLVCMMVAMKMSATFNN
jgi:hypothetical protein